MRVSAVTRGRQSSQTLSFDLYCSCFNRTPGAGWHSACYKAQAVATPTAPWVHLSAALDHASKPRLHTGAAEIPEKLLAQARDHSRARGRHGQAASILDDDKPSFATRRRLNRLHQFKRHRNSRQVVAAVA